MDDEERKIGDINVTMRDGNNIDHIGHKITFHAPAPSPNAIWQDGNEVGEIGGAPIAEDGSYRFEKLFVGGSFDTTREFKVQGVTLKVDHMSAESSASIGGRPPLRTLWNAVCRVV